MQRASDLTQRETDREMTQLIEGMGIGAPMGTLIWSEFTLWPELRSPHYRIDYEGTSPYQDFWMNPFAWHNMEWIGERRLTPKWIASRLLKDYASLWISHDRANRPYVNLKEDWGGTGAIAASQEDYARWIYDDLVDAELAVRAPVDGGNLRKVVKGEVFYDERDVVEYLAECPLKTAVLQSICLATMHRKGSVLSLIGKACGLAVAKRMG